MKDAKLNKKLAIIAISAFSLALLCIWVGTLIEPQACTLAGCFDYLSVAIQGEVPRDYYMIIDTPKNETITVHCVDGKDVVTTRPHSTHCHPGGFTHMNSSPKWIQITFRWDGREIIQKVRPEYEDFRPNGPDCPPKCRAGRAEFILQWD